MTEGTNHLDDSTLNAIDEEGRRSAPGSALLTIGGARAVTAVVDEFYRRLLADPATGAFFGSVDLNRLKRHQVLMLVKVLGGPDRYDGRDLRSAHLGLGVTGEIYARVCLHLLTVMHDFKVPMDILVAVNQILAGVQEQIVTGASGPTEDQSDGPG